MTLKIKYVTALKKINYPRDITKWACKTYTRCFRWSLRESHI